jgi:hypothetical protein
LRCGLKVARTRPRHLHPSPPWPRLPLPRPQSHPDPVPTSRFRPGIPDRRIGPGSDARSWKLISWRRKSTRMACFSSKIFYSAPSVADNSKKLTGRVVLAGRAGLAGLPGVAGRNFYLWRRWTWLFSKPPGGGGSRTRRPPRQVFDFAMARRCSCSCRSCARRSARSQCASFGGSFIGGMLGPISGEF